MRIEHQIIFNEPERMRFNRWHIVGAACTAGAWAVVLGMACFVAWLWKI